ncbi:MAG: class I SAM-dependent methyltransferase, partial [Firmicutes bacterium]|nr:class I SAM-dependent methyltransferase [Bacillota bacterium]
PFAGYRAVMEYIYGAVTAIPGARVLDLGVGTSVLAKGLHDAGAAVTGVDFSAEMLQIAGKNMPGVRLIQWDFSRGLPPELAGERFDFILSTYALHHLPDADKLELFKDLAPNLTAGGAIIDGDVMFPDWDAYLACKAAAGAEFDDDERDGEFYLVYDEMREALETDWDASFIPMSPCAGILVLQHFKLNSNSKE